MLPVNPNRRKDPRQSELAESCTAGLLLLLLPFLSGRAFSQNALDGFDPNVNGRTIWTLAFQAGGEIILGGEFTSVGGVVRSNIARLHVDGGLDMTFDPGTDGEVRAVALQADGKILVGGFFSRLGGQPRANIGRLNSDGTLDNTFDPGTSGVDPGQEPGVHSIVVQPDGKIVLAGRFTRLGGQPRNHIGRLFPDGHVDAGFDPGADTAVRSEEHTSELQSLTNLVCRLLLEKKKTDKQHNAT